MSVRSRIAVACSGGADSLALAIMAAEEWEVIALIVDHKLRKESAGEAKKTAAILKKLKIKSKILAPRKSKITSDIQNQARKLRYELMADFCKKNKIQILATAHHADDVAENVLLRISRGSGVDGLSGIPEIVEFAGIKIIRPVLKYRKSELEDFLRSRKIKWVEDPTNKSNKYKRNILRHSLEKLEEPALVTKRLVDLADNMKRVRDFLETETAKAEKSCVKYNQDRTELIISDFLSLHEEIQYRLLVRVIMRIAKQEYRPRFEKLKNLKNAIEEKQTKTLAGLIFKPQKDFYYISCEKP